MGKDAKRALQQLGERFEQQLEKLHNSPELQELGERMQYALDKLKNSIDPPAYATEVEDGFDESEGQVWRPPSCPLILDLDGDGIELIALEDYHVRFDIDGDGFRERTGWLKSDDGFLVFDRNSDGYINDISELFGNQTTDGFIELQELDSNNDGQITSADTNFAQLQIWRDLDQDGYSDVQELFTLDELSITKIDAVGNSVNITNEGHLINETAGFESADGTQHEVANVWFNLDQFNSYYDPYSTFNSPVVITEQIINLPNLRGYGNLPDLRIAIAQDSDLLDLVESFAENVEQGDISTARQLMRPIMYRWAGVDDVDPTNIYPNANINTQELRFLEAFVGRSWSNTNPNETGGVTLTNTYKRLQRDLEARLLVQLTKSTVNYNTTTEVYEFSGSLDEAVEQFETVIAKSQNSANETIDLQAFTLAQYIQQESGGKADWILGDVLDEILTGTTADNQLFGMLGNDSLAGGEGNDTLNSGAGNDTLKGGSGNDAYFGGNGNDLLSDSYNNNLSDSDTLDGGTGNDTLRGGGGNDTYIFDRGYGQDLISDYGTYKSYYQAPRTTDGGASDTLIFGSSITHDNLRWNFDGKDLSFTLTDSPDDKLTIGNFVNSIYRVENFQIEQDLVSMSEIMSSQTWSDSSETNSFNWTSGAISYKGLVGDDTITTGGYDDEIWGEAGNDRLNTGEGNDTVDGGDGDDVLSAGNGDNLIYGGSGSDNLSAGSGSDTLFGQDQNDTLYGNQW